MFAQCVLFLLLWIWSSSLAAWFMWPDMSAPVASITMWGASATVGDAHRRADQQHIGALP